MTGKKGPRLLALFQKRIEGDDALLELARLRFREAGLGAEYYAANPEELGWLLRFRPQPAAPVVVHLPREMDLFAREGRRQMLSWAVACKDRIYGLVVHDQMAIRGRPDDYRAVLVEIDTALRAVKGSPLLFIEYAAGLAPELFCRLFESIQALRKISACIDIGHLGIWQARDIFSRRHPGEDVCGLDPSDSRVPGLMADIEAAVQTSLPAVLQVITRLGALGKPLHFHLHDGHPLSKASDFGVSDHLSLLAEIPIPFQFKGKRVLAPMFGPAGLQKIVTRICATLEPDFISLTLEIHPTAERLALGAAAHLFSHWQDKTNAERMNHWLAVLDRNRRLLEEVPALWRP
jgi:hypothetical protein